MTYRNLAAVIALSALAACSEPKQESSAAPADAALLQHTIFDSTFGILTSVAGWWIASDAAVVLADRDRLFLIDVPSGSVLYRVGKEGEGPGEFRRIQWLSAAGPDALAAYDAALGRITYFDADLSIRATRSIQALEGQPQCVLGEDAVVSTRVVDYRGNTGREEGRYHPLLALEIVDSTGHRPLANVEYPPQIVFVRATGFTRTNMLMVPPFSPKLRIHCTDSTAMWTDSTGNFVLVAAGDTIRPLRFDGLEPRPISRRDHAAAAESVGQSAGRDIRAMFEEAAERERRSLSPALADFIPSRTGTVWALGYYLDELGRKVWSEHRLDGSLVRRVAVPAEFEMGVVLPGYFVGHAVRADDTFEIRIYSYQM